MVAVNNLASMHIKNMSKNYNIVIVPKEITGCYGEILVGMVIDTLLRGADNRYPPNPIKYFSKHAEN